MNQFRQFKMEIDPERLQPTRKTLINRLKDWDDQESWKEFFETYWRLIYVTALKSGLSDAEAQDVVQETLISVCKHMPTFEYDPKRGSFKSWLLRLTYWRIMDQRRKRRALGDQIVGETEGPKTDHLESIADPSGFELEQLWEEEWRRNLREAAMERVKQRVDPQHYQIFLMSVVKQKPVKSISEILNISVPRIYLVKHRISKQVQKEMEHLEEKVL